MVLPPTEEWNGTNWTEVDIPDSTSTAAGGGESSESAIWVGYFTEQLEEINGMELRVK